MRVVPIKELAVLTLGETVPSVRGKLTAIYDRKTGQGQNGEWSLQNCELTDSTGKIKVKLDDRDALPKDWRGREVYISCNNGDKGLTGIKIKEETYKGNTSRILSVTESAHLDDAAAQEPPQDEPAPAKAPKAAPTQAAPAQAKPVNGNGNGNGGKESIKAYLNRQANLYLHCMEAAKYVVDTFDNLHPDSISPDHFQGVCSCLFIQASRDFKAADVATGTFKA